MEERQNLPTAPNAKGVIEFDPEQMWEMAQQELDPKRWQFLNAMIQTFGNVTQASKLCKIKSRKTYTYWLKTDPLFKALIDSQEFAEMQKDYAESQLFKNMEDRKEASVIFFLKTKAKDRGYVERTEVKSVDPVDAKPSWFKGDDVPKNYNPDDYEEAEVVQ